MTAGIVGTLLVGETLVASAAIVAVRRARSQPKDRRRSDTIADTGVAAWASITPPSFRHTFITGLLASGAPLQQVQDAAGHVDPRTTRRCDHSRLDDDAHPTYRLIAHLRDAAKRDINNIDAGDVA